MHAGWNLYQTPDEPVILGDEPPLVTDEGKRPPPDRRQVSIRWLVGTVLTGATALFLIGGALLAAFDGNLVLTTPPRAATAEASGGSSGQISKGDRIRPVIEKVSSKTVIKVSTVTRSEDQDLIKVRPHMRVISSLLTRAPTGAKPAPRFDPQAVFSSTTPTPEIETAASDTIYTAEVEGQVAITTRDFPLDAPGLSANVDLSAREVERMVSGLAGAMVDGDIKVAAADAEGAEAFAADESMSPDAKFLPARITEENVSFLEKRQDAVGGGKVLLEETATIGKDQSLVDLLLEKGASSTDAESVWAVIRYRMGLPVIPSGVELRIGLDEDELAASKRRLMRVSVFHSTGHIATVARSDTGVFVPAPAPVVARKQEDSDTVTYSGPVLTTYQSLYQTGFSHEIPDDLIQQLVRIFSFDVDFNSRVRPSDSLEVFYSIPEGDENPEILYAAVTINNVQRKFYRFRTADDGRIDYYDAQGKSAKKFLMRKPLSNAIFRSSFGMRRHPILKIYKMHTGVDWKARRGTPIYAAGNGIVEQAAWRGGYGRYVRLRHSNGYKTAYAHMFKFAKGIRKGARVRQGQIIGYVGSTGLSTGPHLHYEVLVNGRHVDPMRIRLPRGRVLKDDMLAAFQAERQRVDKLLNQDRPPPTKLASN